MKKYLQFAQVHEDLPEDLCLLLDVSGSMRTSDYPPNRLDAARQAAATLLAEKARRHPTDRVGLVSFADRATTVHQLVEVRDGRNRLESAIQSLAAGGSTNITAGLAAAAALLGCGSSTSWRVASFLKHVLQDVLCEPSTTESVPSASERRQRIILLGDGAHHAGGRPPDLEAESLKRAGVSIDVIGIGEGPDADEFDEPMMRRIASLDPVLQAPRYVWIGDTAELIETFKSLAGHLARWRE